jgi:predicted amino acid racemase
MAFIELDRKRLKHNYHFLDHLMKTHGKSWSVVTKLFCGNKIYLKELLDLGIKEVCVSRISNLKTIKAMNPDVQTVYIKPPAKRSIKNIVKYADVSFNTELETIKLLSKEAQLQEKVHKVIIMIEMGDLREGVLGEHLIDFYRSVFELPNIEVSGIGTNLNCLNGVLPSEDKLIQLSLYEQLIEATFNKKIPWVSGGTSVILPMLNYQQVPEGVNHFRIGDTLFFGNDIINEVPFKGMQEGVLKLYSEIIEITEKPKIPNGQIAENPSGETFEIDEKDYGKLSFRAIIDIGLLDISTDFLIPVDSKISFIGASSDMIVVDLGETDLDYKVGDLISFDLKYMGALALLSSNYIEKVVV